MPLKTHDLSPTMPHRMARGLGSIAQFLSSNLLLLAIGGALVLTWVAPQAGQAMAGWGFVSGYIIAIFLLQGLGIEMRELTGAGRIGRALVLGAIISYVLAPLVGVQLARLADMTPSDRIGFVMMCCTAPTIVSGIVIASRAGGEAGLALVLTVALNALGILAMPLALGWSLRTVVTIDQGDLITRLIVLILLPSAVGMGVRRVWPGIVDRTKSLRRHLPVILFGLTVWVALSPHAAEIHALTLARILGLLWPAIVVHGSMLVLAYVLGRWGTRLSDAQSRSLAFVSSQKSLPVALALWSGAFAASVPLAILPPIVFHPGQILLDSLIARFLPRPKGSDA